MKHFLPCVVFATSCLILVPDQTRPCSSFCLPTPGQVVVGANLDLSVGDGIMIVNRRGARKRGWLPSTTGDYATWTSKYGSVTVSIAGREWAHYGMNEVGLVMTTAALPGSRCTPPDERPPLSGNFWAQYLLDNFRTIEQVVMSASTVRLENDADHYLICDRDGNCAVVECIDGEMTCHTNDTMPVKALTNTAYSESLRRYETDDIPTPDEHCSVERFFRAASMLSSYAPDNGNSPVNYAFEVLKNISQSGRTQWSIVFDVTNLRVLFKTRNHQQIRYLDLKTIDLACSPSLVALGVNEPVSGDVGGQLRVYSREANIALMYDTFRRFGIEMTQDEIEEHVLFLESFYGEPCPTRR